jgi:hypothetical protein
VICGYKEGESSGGHKKSNVTVDRLNEMKGGRMPVGKFTKDKSKDK